MIRTSTNSSTPIRSRSAATMNSLNRNWIREPKIKIEKEIRAMGLAACQGLCITYNLHSKKFCH